MRSTFGCACSAPPTLGFAFGAPRAVAPKKATASRLVSKLRSLAAHARAQSNQARQKGYLADSVQLVARGRHLADSADLVQRMPTTSPIAAVRAAGLDAKASASGALARAMEGQARAFHAAMAESFRRESLLLRVAIREKKGTTPKVGLFGELGAVDTSANPYSKPRGYYADGTYGYFYDPKKGITVYRDGKLVQNISLGTSSYAKAYNNLFSPSAKHPASKTSRKGAGLPPAIVIDPELVKKGIDAGASVTVAALSAGGKKGGKKHGRGGGSGVAASEPVQAPSSFPSWTPLAVGGGLILVILGGMAFTGGKAQAAPSRAA